MRRWVAKIAIAISLAVGLINLALIIDVRVTQDHAELLHELSGPRTEFDPGSAGLGFQGLQSVCIGYVDEKCASSTSREIGGIVAWVPGTCSRARDESLPGLELRSYYLAKGGDGWRRSVQLFGVISKLWNESLSPRALDNETRLLLSSYEKVPAYWKFTPDSSDERSRVFYRDSSHSYFHCGSLSRGPASSCVRWVHQEGGKTSYHELFSSNPFLITETASVPPDAEPRHVGFDVLRSILQRIKYSGMEG
jgi:hypothetical protein